MTRKKSNRYYGACRRNKKYSLVGLLCSCCLYWAYFSARHLQHSWTGSISLGTYVKVHFFYFELLSGVFLVIRFLYTFVSLRRQTTYRLCVIWWARIWHEYVPLESPVAHTFVTNTSLIVGHCNESACLSSLDDSKDIVSKRRTANLLIWRYLRFCLRITLLFQQIRCENAGTGRLQDVFHRL